MGAISPLPTCNATPGVLCTTVSPVVAHWTGTPDVRELPETRQMQSGPLMSLAAVGPECSITRVPRHVVTAGQPTGRSLPPCDEPSTQGCGSSVVTTPEHRRIPETAGQSVAPHAPVKSSVHPTPRHMRSCETGTPESPVAIVETQVSPVGRNACQMIPLSSHLLCPAKPC